MGANGFVSAFGIYGYILCEYTYLHIDTDYLSIPKADTNQYGKQTRDKFM